MVIILAVDGGGIRGVIPAYILKLIEQHTGKPCFQLFDIVGGTSTGAIISAALTTPMPGNPSQYPYAAASILGFYQNDGARIFVPQNCDIAYCATYFANDGQGNGVEPYIQSKVGASTSLSSARQAMMSLEGSRIKHVFTTGYTVNSKDQSPTNPVPGVDYGPYLFNWMDAAAGQSDDYFVWEAARGSSAAPVYFPIAHVGGGGGLNSAAAERWVVDGGVMSNNPAVWAVTEAFRTGLASSLSDIAVISLGTGVYPGAAGVGINNNSTWDDNVPANGNWSATPWVVLSMYDLEGNLNDGGTIIDVITDSVQLVAGSQLTALVSGGLQYFRLEPTLPQALAALDNISPTNIKALLKCTDDYLKGSTGAKIFARMLSVLNEA